MAAAAALAAAPMHVLIFPAPLLGHVSPMLVLAEALSLKGLLVTFLTTEHVDRQLRQDGGVDALLGRCPGIRLRTITGCLPADLRRPDGQVRQVFASLRARSPAFRDLLVSLREGTDGRSQLACVILDEFLPFAAEVAEELGIPVIACSTSGACSFWAYFCIPKLIEEGEIPFPEICNMDELVRGVPGMESFLRRRDLPTPCRTKDANDPSLQVPATATQRTPRARGLIINSMDALDAAVLTHIRTRCPVTYAVGPLHRLVQTLGPGNATDGSAAVSNPPSPPPSSPSLWREDRTCLAWLDTQPAKSVVYVSFGSLTVLSRAQLLEFWYGLVNTHHRFLWVIRPDLLVEKGGEAGGLPTELTEATKERGCLVGWAPQQAVLAHRAVGAFLTHSGWNSTMESISAGVPMLCWPFFYDQMVNSRCVSEVWRVGVDMKDTCERATVERMVREVMEGKTAEELRRNASRLAKMVDSCVGDGGSSRVNLEKLVQDIRSLSFVGTQKIE